MTHDNWMIYGANGYTGKLAAEQAASKGQRPLLAGRNEVKLQSIAEQLDLDYVVFDLNDREQAVAALAGIDVVLHCAGPFSATSKPMVDACLASKTHYLDITGEIDIFEAIQARNAEAEQAGVLLMPGVGFDVVPTDCLAAMLAKALPDATHLEMAFCGDGGASPGTAKTLVEGLGMGGRMRVNGELITVANAQERKAIEFACGSRWCMTIPWGDVSTAYYTTGIPNIKVFTAVPKGFSVVTRMLSPIMGLTNLGFIQNFLKGQIDKKVKGPTEQERNTLRMNLWGKATNAKGETKQAYLEIAEGYRFTVDSGLAVVQKVLAGETGVGSKTPAMALGSDFVLSFEDSKIQWLEE